jgi:Xaa-Pro aminopeptidase
MAAEQLAAAGVEATVSVGPSLQAQAEDIGRRTAALGTLGLEARHIPWADQRALAASLRPELVPTIDAVEVHRVVKDPGEVDRIEAACHLASAALANVFDLQNEQPTEAEFALALDDEMRRLGAQGPSFPTIVAAGPSTALPHHSPGPRRMVEGDVVVCDFGALVDGYHSDMTRSWVIGEPTAEQAELLALVTAAEAAGVAAVRAGVAAADVDRTCRDLIAAAGLADRFTHGTGHGVGLLIHESPWLNPTSTDVLVDGAVITVEPGVYLHGSHGVRVEDAVLVTARGCRPLTTTPKDLACLPSPPPT